MQLEYDLNVGALYISLSDQPVAATEEAGDNANIDLGHDGRVVGIEVISAEHRWPLARILAKYQIDPADAAQLSAYFMSAGPAPAAQRMRKATPVIVTKPIAPWTPSPVAA